MSEKKKQIEQSERTKLLQRVAGLKKTRDLFILQCLAEGFTTDESLARMIEVFPKENKIVKGRVSQIKNNNKELLDELTMQTEFITKAGRIRLANKELRDKQRRKEKSKKDRLEWVEYIRKEQNEEGKVSNEPIHIIIDVDQPPTNEEEEKQNS